MSLISLKSLALKGGPCRCHVHRVLGAALIVTRLTRSEACTACKRLFCSRLNRIVVAPKLEPAFSQQWEHDCRSEDSNAGLHAYMLSDFIVEVEACGIRGPQDHRGRLRRAGVIDRFQNDTSLGRR